MGSVHWLLYFLCRQQQLFHVLAAYSVYNPVSSSTALYGEVEWGAVGCDPGMTPKRTEHTV